MDESVDPLAVEDLVALYFAAAEPEERDAVFGELAAWPLEASRPFMAAVLAHDEDPYMRAAAAGVLWREGDAPAHRHLMDLLHGAKDELLVEQALAALLQAQPQQLFEPARALWQDAARPLAIRRLGMLGMEQADAAASYTAFRGALAAWGPADPVELTAMALMAMVRLGTADAEAAIADVRTRIGTQPGNAEDTTLMDLCDEALALVAAQDEAGASV